MAWIYLAASEDSVSHSKTGSDQSPTVKRTSTYKPFFCQECRMVQFQSHRYGTTCGHFRTTFKKSTSSMEASHVRTLALQELEEAWKESEAAFIGSCTGLSKKYAQTISSWRTSLPLEQEACAKSCNHLAIYGMTVGGQVYQPQKLEPRTLGKDGSFLPTPSANSYGSNQGGGAGRTGKVRPSLNSMAKHNMWPTPRTSDATGGPLNPMWVEWLMGYPEGWTELKDWAMQWFRPKRKKHLKD